MDYLLYDLVEEVVNFLPRADVETIAKVAVGKPALQNWSFAAEDHLEKRFLVDVRACVQKLDNHGYWDDEEEESDEEPRILLQVAKCLPKGRKELWNFTQCRYAWIRNITIETTSFDRPFEETDMLQVLRSVSLPVDPSARGTLHLDRNSRRYEYYEYSDSDSDIWCDDTQELGAGVVYLSWKMLQATQKEFVKVLMNAREEDTPSSVEDFVSDYIGRVPSLEQLYCIDGPREGKKVCAAVASQFGRTRGRPLDLRLFNFPFELDGIELMIENWLKSDGIFEEKTVTCRYDRSSTTLETIKDKYNAIEGPKDEIHLVHPKRHSCFVISREIRIVKFQPWHVPVSFKWIDSVIDKWKDGDGFYACRGVRAFNFSFQEADDWLKVEEKYRPWLEKCKYTKWTTISLAHPSKTMSLVLKKDREWLDIGVKPERFSDNKLETLISNWEKGNGETLLNGLTKMEIDFCGDRSWVLSGSHSHPVQNARLLVVSKGLYNAVCGAYYRMRRITICPIDPESVEDWNLDVLFGSLRV